MRAFAAGEIDVLVATTVVEVGVDVPNATVMVVMDADRFGVSQLHQLRGRVARGKHAGLCLLVTEAPAASPTGQRLAAVAATSDGFELARLDLETRREGDVLGAAQSGKRSGIRLLSLLEDEELIADRPRRGHRAAGDRARPGRPPGAGRRGRRAGHRRARRMAGEGMSALDDSADLRRRRRTAAQGAAHRRPAHRRPRPRGALQLPDDAARPPTAPPCSTSTPAPARSGLEALSRGAATVVLRGVLARRAAGPQGEPRRRRSAGRRGSSPARCPPSSAGAPPARFDLVLADPPYATPAEEVSAVLRSPRRAAGGWRPSAVVVVERSSREEAFEWPTPLVGLRDRRYGEALLRYGRSS